METVVAVKYNIQNVNNRKTAASDLYNVLEPHP